MCLTHFELKVSVKRFRATLNCAFCILSSHRLQPHTCSSKSDGNTSNTPPRPSPPPPLHPAPPPSSASASRSPSTPLPPPSAASRSTPPTPTAPPAKAFLCHRMYLLIRFRSKLPHKIAKLLFTITDSNVDLYFCGRVDFLKLIDKYNVSINSGFIFRGSSV